MEEPKSYSIEKLNESNYCSWSQVVESRLDDQDLWEVVKGQEAKPVSPGAARAYARDSRNASTTHYRDDGV